MTIRAVTFDIGGTLIDPWPSVGYVYAQVAAELRLGEFEPGQLDEQFAAAWRAKERFDYSRRAWRELVCATFGRWVACEQMDRLFPALYERFEEPHVWRVFDDVLPTLSELRSAGIKLGIISNWDERLSPLLAGLNLTRWFDAVTVSCETGVTKPAPLIFERASAALGVPAAEILHVGDSAEEDLRGAQAAGFRALLVERRAANSWALNTLAAIPQALAAMGFRSPPD